MHANLESTLSRTLGQALGLPSGANEMALARADREQLGTALMHRLTGQNLLSPADVYRVVPRRTWIRRKADTLGFEAVQAFEATRRCGDEWLAQHAQVVSIGQYPFDGRLFGSP